MFTYRQSNYKHFKQMAARYRRRQLGYDIKDIAKFGLKGGAAYAVKQGIVAGVKAVQGGPVKKKPSSRKKIKSEVKKIKKTIVKMKRHDDATTGTCRYRLMASYRQLSSNNAQSEATYSASDSTALQNSLASLKFFDASNPGTLLTANGGTGTYQRNYLFDSVTSKLIVRNNYQSDCKVKIYLCKVKDDTNQTPSACWAAGIADGGNASGVTQLNQFPTDYEVVKDLWNLKVVANKQLSPGDTCSVSHTEKDIEFDPATYDTHALEYQREYRSFQWLVVCEGVLAHDTTLDQQGIQQTGVDVMLHRSYCIKYNAGVNIKYIQLSEVIDTPTNGFVQSHQPIPDNIAYSVA